MPEQKRVLGFQLAQEVNEVEFSFLTASSGDAGPIDCCTCANMTTFIVRYRDCQGGLDSMDI